MCCGSLALDGGVVGFKLAGNDAAYVDHVGELAQRFKAIGFGLDAVFGDDDDKAAAFGVALVDLGVGNACDGRLNGLGVLGSAADDDTGNKHAKPLFWARECAFSGGEFRGLKLNQADASEAGEKTASGDKTRPRGVFNLFPNAQLNHIQKQGKFKNPEISEKDRAKAHVGRRRRQEFLN